MAREKAETVSNGWRFKGRHHYILMAREEAETVSKGGASKNDTHVHTDGTRRGRNRE